MRRTLAKLVLIAALGAAPVAALAQAQQDYQRQDSANDQDSYNRSEMPSAGISPKRAYARGVEAFQAKRYKDAIYILARLTDRAPNHEAAWRVLGAAYANEGRWDASRRAYERALYLSPNQIVSHAGLGLAFLNLNSPKAQREADWLKARTEACADTCPEAAILKQLETSGPFAVKSAS